MDPYRTPAIISKKYPIPDEHIFVYDEASDSALVQVKYEGPGGRIDVIRKQYDPELPVQGKYGLVVRVSSEPSVNLGSYLATCAIYEAASKGVYAINDAFIPWGRIIVANVIERKIERVRFDWTWIKHLEGY